MQSVWRCIIYIEHIFFLCLHDILSAFLLIVFLILQISLNKDKSFEIDSLYRNYDLLSIPIPTNQAQASRAIVGNSTMEENYAFNNVHHIYDQVYYLFLLTCINLYNFCFVLLLNKSIQML